MGPRLRITDVDRVSLANIPNQLSDRPPMSLTLKLTDYMVQGRGWEGPEKGSQVCINRARGAWRVRRQRVRQAGGRGVDRTKRGAKA